MSLYLRSEIAADYPRAAAVARQTIDLILAAGLQAGQVATINIPPLRPGQEPAGVKIVRQCIRPWADTYEQRTDPRGRPYYWNSSVFTLGSTEDDTDVAALREGYVTVTPLHFDLTNYSLLREWEGKMRNKECGGVVG